MMQEVRGRILFITSEDESQLTSLSEEEQIQIIKHHCDQVNNFIDDRYTTARKSLFCLNEIIKHQYLLSRVVFRDGCLQRILYFVIHHTDLTCDVIHEGQCRPNDVWRTWIAVLYRWEKAERQQDSLEEYLHEFMYSERAMDCRLDEQNANDSATFQWLLDQVVGTHNHSGSDNHND